ncbi:MAG: hypothetical protein EOO92_08330 [Pedobacter sp.]|nr:MAG: hypothetical protein EOO92_08330 [Pedobacter sp.]
MNSELINEFNLMQQSRVANKYEQTLSENIYTPVKEANTKVINWVSERGHMLMAMEARFNRSVKHLRKKYLKF